MEWLLALLQEAMTGVMAGEATPLQKANAVARLAALYLKASRAAELEQANAALAERAAAEVYTAELEARATAWAERLGEERRSSERSADPEDAVPLAARTVPAPVGTAAGFSVERHSAGGRNPGNAPQANVRRPEAVRSDGRAPP